MPIQSTAIRRVPTPECAKLMRSGLATLFPTTKFAVRSKSYSGGSHIAVFWCDGPTVAQVQAVVEPFTGSTFDGSIDLKSYHESTLDGERVHCCADSVFCERRFSVAFLEAVARTVATHFGVDAPVIHEEYGEAVIEQNWQVCLPHATTPVHERVWWEAHQICALALDYRTSVLPEPDDTDPSSSRCQEWRLLNQALIVTGVRLYVPAPDGAYRVIGVHRNRTVAARRGTRDVIFVLNAAQWAALVSIAQRADRVPPELLSGAS